MARAKAKHRAPYYRRDWAGIIFVLIGLIGLALLAILFYRSIMGATITDSVVVGKYEVDVYEEREWKCHQLAEEPQLYRCIRKVQVGL